MKKVTYKLIKSFDPCYDPIEIGMPTDYEASPVEFIHEYRNKVKNCRDIFWVLLKPGFLSEKDLRLFAVWCVRRVQHLANDERIVQTLDVVERFANGEASQDELRSAKAAARDAKAAAWDAAGAAARAAARDAAWAAARAAGGDARAAAWDAAEAAAGAAAWAAARADWAAAGDAWAAAKAAGGDAETEVQIDRLVEVLSDE